MPGRILEPSDIIITGGVATGWLPLLFENFSTALAALASMIAVILGILKCLLALRRLRNEKQETRDDPSGV